MSAALSLRAAVHRKLTSDSELAGLIGPERIFDEVPEAMRAPFIVLGDVDSRPAGSDADDGEEHRMTLNVWSRGLGLAEALTTANRVATALDGAALDLEGQRLANLVWLGTDARGTGDGRHRYAALRFRAVTEPG